MPAQRRPRSRRGRAASPHQLFAHLAWTTLGRLPLIDAPRANATEAQLIALCRRLDIRPVSLAAVADHVHLLIQYKPSQSVSVIAATLMRTSSQLLVEAGHPVCWGVGYAAASVSPDGVRRVMRFIGRQQLTHPERGRAARR